MTINIRKRHSIICHPVGWSPAWIQAYAGMTFVLVIFLQSCLSLKDRPYDNEIPGSFYEVKKGDTLSQIAKKYKANSEEIMDVNGIENARDLRVGQLLFIPDPDPIGTYIAKSQKKVEIRRVSAKKPVPKLSPPSAIFDFPVLGGKVFKEFSRNKKAPYDGIGIKAAFGTPVMAAADGKVLFVGDDGTRFGLLVIIEHKEPFITVYTHLAQAKVKAGQNVKQREVIAQVGKSGGVASPRLHFQVRVDQKPQNPLIYLKK